AVHAAFQPRIYGGTETTIQNHPYQVSIEEYGQHVCGGSIIDSSWILSAAHCFESSPKAYGIRAGSTTRGEGGVVRQASIIIIHPKYNENNLDYDAALIKVSKPFTFNSRTKPIFLATREYAEGTQVTVTGWGLDENKKYPTNLREVRMKIITRKGCKDSHPLQLITDRMICAGVPEGGKDSCEGDSGGPLVVRGRLAGIVSWGGDNCGVKREYGVYTNIPKIYEWVYKVIKYNFK
ncbi:Trypsin-7, partial [Blattella germanica]